MPLVGSICIETKNKPFLCPLWGQFVLRTALIDIITPCRPFGVPLVSVPPIHSAASLSTCHYLSHTHAYVMRACTFLHHVVAR